VARDALRFGGRKFAVKSIVSDAAARDPALSIAEFCDDRGGDALDDVRPRKLLRAAQ
jgi:hypothetical protein